MIKKIEPLLALILSMFLLLSYGTYHLKINLSAEEKLSMGMNNHTLPVMVYIYELKNKDLFNHATSRDLWKNELNYLGNTLINKEEVHLSPDKPISVNLSLNAETKYIGVIALFHDPAVKNWKLIKEIPSHYAYHNETMSVRLKKNELYFE